MTKFASEDVAFFLIGGYDLVGNSTVLSIGKLAELRDQTGFGMSWREFVSINLKSGELTQDGFFDTAAAKTHLAFVGGNGVSRVGMIAIEGGQIADPFTGFVGALQTKYERKVTVGELHGASAGYQVSGKVEEGVIVKTWAAVTTDGDTEVSDVHDVAAPTTGGAGYIELSALTLDGATNLAVTLRHSDDGITWANLGAFTVITAGPTAQRLAIAGEIKDYLAVSWVFTGGAGAASSATFTVGVIRDSNN